MDSRSEDIYVLQTNYTIPTSVLLYILLQLLHIPRWSEPLSSVGGLDGIGEGEGGLEVVGDDEEEDNDVRDWGRGLTWTAASWVE